MLTFQMGRMHSGGKGISKSSVPYKRSPPSWLKISSQEVTEHVCKLAKKGLTPSQVSRHGHGHCTHAAGMYRPLPLFRVAPTALLSRCITVVMWSRFFALWMRRSPYQRHITLSGEKTECVQRNISARTGIRLPKSVQEFLASARLSPTSPPLQSEP